MTTQTLSICFACKRLWPVPDPTGSGATIVKACDAYPKGIPAAISTDMFDHRKPYGGEKDGRLFVQADGEFAKVTLETFDQAKEE